MSSRRLDVPQSRSGSKPPRLVRSNSSLSFAKEAGISKRRHDSRQRRPNATTVPGTVARADSNPNPISPIVTLVVGQECRIFAAHENVLSASPFFKNVLDTQFSGGETKRILLPNEEPEIFASVLEYLYKGDYHPRLVHDMNQNTWELEELPVAATARRNGGRGGGGGREAPTIYHHSVDGEVLKDTVIYCAGEKYGLEELKRIALRKQGLQCGIMASTILTSARYAYANTPDTDSKLRAHYLALIIRGRNTFKRSGTMQLEMFHGGSDLFFDLFVALCNHVDDLSVASSSTQHDTQQDTQHDTQHDTQQDIQHDTQHDTQQSSGSEKDSKS
ncbi:hypothetical protein SMACR_04652 [Sordaria macrospora]|uniref:WGS project CABT00000000 data, contig 2.20 n=2 Tax=Sordaria macrospora TaxID=5147 RepID=F7W1N8_SORMK|nr:uncharacterized protein SMAC_04652 [Sordaria macrospora k-hell]KAA8627973.1 hypothetical protein SMACR_04652 [Sordaria macrospora]WPJ58456.1 hypothetical protein SMAC4_04652 [Sordaria macrospora]CCC11670.1 unnamed protein product [Sordaria macrospora k-hell]